MSLSNYAANKDPKYLRGLFNWGMKPERRFISSNPTIGLGFLPVEKRLKYVPPKEDVLRVILAAETGQPRRSICTRSENLSARPWRYLM